MPTLLSIAPELRQEIYNHVFDHALTVPDLTTKKPIHALLQASAQLRAEAASVYHQAVGTALSTAMTTMTELGPAMFSSMMCGDGDGMSTTQLMQDFEQAGRRCEELKKLEDKLSTMQLFMNLKSTTPAAPVPECASTASGFEMFNASGHFGSATACRVSPSLPVIAEKSVVRIAKELPAEPACPPYAC